MYDRRSSLENYASSMLTDQKKIFFRDWKLTKISPYFSRLRRNPAYLIHKNDKHNV